MAYEPTVWKKGDTITADLMNKMENGVKVVEESIPTPETLATVSKNGLLSKTDFAKLDKITGATTLTAVPDGAELAAVIATVNTIVAVLKTAGIAK